MGRVIMLGLKDNRPSVLVTCTSLEGAGTSLEGGRD